MWGWLQGLRSTPWRTLAAWGVGAAVVLLSGVLLVAWSGIYNVAASRGHLPPIEWLLELGMQSSVRTHSLGITAPADLDDPERARAGAGHFAGGCAPCHGSPAREKNPITSAMLPQPTNLMRAVPDWPPHQLFWIVKHGIKYSGMPAWVAPSRDEEIWNVVAFLRRLPEMTAAEYRRLALGNVHRPRGEVQTLVRNGPPIANLAACARCHDTASAPPVSRYVPRLSGQRRDYLLRALREYADRTRPSGVMQAVAATLDEDDIAQLAEHYARMPPPKPAAAAERPDSALVEDGRRIATEGASARGIPPCVACHGASAAPLFPQLAGQPATYLAMQLRLWQRGGRDRTAAGRIMARIAPRLDETEIRAVAAYFESLPAPAPGATATPAPRATP